MYIRIIREIGTLVTHVLATTHTHTPPTHTHTTHTHTHIQHTHTPHTHTPTPTHGARDITKQIKELIIYSMSFGIWLFPKGHFWAHTTI